MIYRVMKHTKGDRVWFTAERRILGFWIFGIWVTCFRDYYGDPAEYDDVEQALRYIENHKAVNAKVKHERVITL